MLQHTTCPRCAKPLPRAARFCRRCGMALHAAATYDRPTFEPYAGPAGRYSPAGADDTGRGRKAKSPKRPKSRPRPEPELCAA